MNLKRNRMLVLLLAMILLPAMSFGVNKDQFSYDHMRITELREAKKNIGLENLAKEIQDKWSQRDKQAYGSLMVHTLKSWKSACKRADKKAPMNLIRQYAAQALSTYDPNKPDNISIKTELDLVSILHEEYTYSKGKSTDQDWATVRRKGAERWFHAWQRLENAIDENWDSNDIPVENVSPPKGIGIPGFPGMSPEMIKDPVLRAEYEKAIEKNREKAKIRNEQIKLRNIKKMYFRIVEKYLVSTYSIPPYDNTELNSLLNTGVVNDKTSVSPEGSEIQKQEYKQEFSRIKAMRESLRQGETKDLKSFEKFADEIQSKWSQKNKEYHAHLMLEVCKPLSSGIFKEERQYEVARKYALLALAEPNEIPLVTELELTGHVMTDMVTPRAPKGQEWVQQRKKDVQIRLHAWKRLIDAIDPNWDLNEELRSPNAVAASMGFPGTIAPEAIKDPTLRAEYEAAIQRNRQKIKRYTEQSRLHKWLKRFPKRVEAYIIQAYSKPPFNLEELKQYLEKYIADDKTRARILDAVKKNMEKKTQKMMKEPTMQ